jgi:hypothetical protein
MTLEHVDLCISLCVSLCIRDHGACKSRSLHAQSALPFTARFVLIAALLRVNVLLTMATYTNTNRASAQLSQWV